MARPTNNSPSVALTISTTPVVRAILDELARDGNLGKNAAEIAASFVAAKVWELRSNSPVARRLNEIAEAHRTSEP